MKKIKYYIFLLSTLILFSCNSSEDTPKSSSYSVKTKDAYLINHNYAYLDYSISIPDFKGYSGIILSTSPSFDNSIDINGSLSPDNKYVHYAVAYDLTKNTTYYYKAYAEDIYKNRIYGDVQSFKTLNYVVCIKDIGSGQINKRYLEYGEYKYEFDWNASMTVIDAEDIAECGFVVNKIKYPVKPENGTVLTTITTKSNSSIIEQQYSAYAMLKNGDSIYSAINICYLNYNK